MKQLIVRKSTQRLRLQSQEIEVRLAIIHIEAGTEWSFYFTADQAERMRDWLDKWLDELKIQLHCH